MPEDWYDIAYINFDEAILYGNQSEVRQTLTPEQRRMIEDMNSNHEANMQKLLRGFASVTHHG